MRRQNHVSEDAVATVVVAEEFTLVREGLAALCEKSAGCRVIGKCGDGESAVELICRLKPHLALLDLQLPKLFTLEAIRQIRDAGVETRIVVLSMRQDRKSVVEALRSGASAYVLKFGPLKHLTDAFEQIRHGGIYVSPLLDLEKIFVPGRKSEPDDPLDTLSAREHQVFTLLIEGIRAKEIAARLELSPKTVDTYRASLMRKLDIYDVAGLVKYAIRRNIIRTT